MPRRTALRTLVVAVVAGLVGGLLLAAPTSQAARPGTLTGLGCIGDLVDGADTDLNTCTAGDEHIAGTGVPVVNAAETVVYVSNYDEDTVTWYARAANGSLTPRGCIADAPAPAGCAEAQGLEYVWGIRLSTDGKQLYAASMGDDAVVRLNVAADGSLSDGGCLSAPSGPCATTSPWLAEPYSVDVSEDGKDVYVGTWRPGGGVVQLRRSTSGALTATSCVAADASDGCTAAAGATQVTWLDASADGRSVYATSQTGAVAMLKRNPSTGRLTSQGCVGDSEVSADLALGCGTEVPAIAGALGVVASGDGSSVYVVSGTDHTLTHLHRATNGTLTDGGCVQDVGTESGCSQSTEGLNQVAFVTIDSDDDQVLTGSVGDNAVTSFNRAADGAPSAVGCIADSDESDTTCASTTEGLNGSYALTVSPDGRNVYVGGWSDHALALLKRQVAAPAVALTATRKQPLAQLRATLRSDARAVTRITGTADATYRVKVGKKVRTKHTRFALRPARVVLLPATTVPARLQVKKSAALRKLLAHGAKVTLTLTATTTNDGGRVTRKATVRVSR
ncbi:hypothetical protein [Nocardioides conyzicola]|uniref:Lactonase family protein n=1 Tax=Nocardioides conyzicola TaxID=1651781 RepID=A0ABP8Y240_9ACTN